MKLKVAVLMGGTSPEREVSIQSGEAVVAHLDRERFAVLPIEIRADGSWVLRDDEQIGDGTPSILLQAKVDVALLALHGAGGEDGAVQGLLETLGIAYTGSGVFASAVGMNKETAKVLMAHFGVRTPRGTSIQAADRDADGILLQAEREWGFPMIVKPCGAGSSIGVYRVEDPSELRSRVSETIEAFGTVLIEEFVKGREFSCGVLGNSGDGAPEALLATEIIHGAGFFDYASKYGDNGAREVTPAEISPEETDLIRSAAVRVHQVLGCDGLSRVDLILGEEGPYVLEINTIPGMTRRSLCPQQAEASGMGFSGLLTRMVDLAMEKTAGDGRL